MRCNNIINTMLFHINLLPRDLQIGRTDTLSNEIAVFLKTIYCYFWTPSWPPIVMKHDGRKYDIKHMEFQQFGTFGPSIFSEIVNIRWDQCHFLMFAIGSTWGRLGQSVVRAFWRALSGICCRSFLFKIKTTNSSVIFNNVHMRVFDF